MMDHLTQRIAAYCARITSEASPLLQELERETHRKTLSPQMLSGRLQGQFLRMLSLLLQPQRILEIGTFTGYGTLCLAEGLRPGGRLDTIESNPEILHITRKYLARSPHPERVRLHVGQALDLLPNLSGPYDLVFIDAGKQAYSAFYHAVVDKLRPGGLILADNVLWSGKVLEPTGDADAEALHAFNLLVREDPRTEQLLLPLRDGMLIARRLPQAASNRAANP